MSDKVGLECEHLQSLTNRLPATLEQLCLRMRGESLDGNVLIALMNSVLQFPNLKALKLGTVKFSDELTSIILKRIPSTLTSLEFFPFDQFDVDPLCDVLAKTSCRIRILRIGECALNVHQTERLTAAISKNCCIRDSLHDLLLITDFKAIPVLTSLWVLCDAITFSIFSLRTVCLL